MALDQLIATLETRGAGEVAEILGAARAEALSIARKARARMAQRRAEVEAAREQEWQSRANAAVAEARRLAVADVLEARAGAVERVWQCAGELLSDPDVRERLRSALASHVQEALPYLEGRDIVVRCPGDLVDAVRAVGPVRGASIRVEADDSVGAGAVVAAADGSVVIDNTLESRLARVRPKLVAEWTARLASAAAPEVQRTSRVTGLE